MREIRGCRETFKLTFWDAFTLALLEELENRGGTPREELRAWQALLHNWDCTIEELAEAAAKDCPIPAKPPANYGAAAAKQKGGKKCNATSLTRTMMRNWWNQGAKKQADQQSVADNGEFSQVFDEALENASFTHVDTCPTAAKAGPEGENFLKIQSYTITPEEAFEKVRKN
ncbi:hypothetical protein Y032_0024g1089 [Ancylostoma ceylanicum]|uniref:Uncharacterized protein n=1 Tax=Ancylostoma ceylanicum TaxID=53326 RepID=A0A016UXF9_9BILA|nr:hypothetical protein Y032_0024g1089 [Ancylostoma ceylanicum]